MTKTHNTPQKAPEAKRKGLIEDLLAVTAGAVVRTAIDIAPKLGEMILSGATRDETLDALDAALRASRSAVSAALSVRHAAMLKRQTTPQAAPQAAPSVEGTCQRCGLFVYGGEYVAGLPPDPKRFTCLACVMSEREEDRARSVVVPAPAVIVWDGETEQPSTRNERRPERVEPQHVETDPEELQRVLEERQAQREVEDERARLQQEVEEERARLLKAPR